MKNPNGPRLIYALLPILVLILLLSLNVVLFKDNTLDGSNQIALLLSATLAGIIAFLHRNPWSFIREKIVKSISSSMPSMLILLLIGSLAGTWMLSGVVPAIIYYGLGIIQPKIFLFTAVIVSGTVSLATGSSWSTVATIGVALNGIGQALGIHPGLVAGAIISGAYFGDKISPLSDTTNLAPAMTGTDLFTHIKYMLYTTVPSMIITLIIFLIIGFNYDYGNIEENISVVKESIAGTFNLSPVLFIVPVLLIFVIIKKVPPLPALMIGTLLGGLFAIVFQPDLVNQVSGIENNYPKSSYIALFKSMYGETKITTSNVMINELLVAYGMSGMLNTIWLILSAMIFGGVMDAGGMLKRIAHTIIGFAKNTGSLVSSTVLTCIFFNITASDQYISIVVPGRMFSDIYKKKGLKPEVLSRTLEDAGTQTSVLVPWNTCGATQSRVLGVSTFTYLPYCFFNLISPLMSVLVAYLNIKIRRITESEEKR